MCAELSVQPRYTRGFPGKLSPERARIAGLALLQIRRVDLANEGFSVHTYRSIALKVGVSHTTIENWDRLDMSSEGILDRQRLKAPKTKFSEIEESVICGWVIYQDLTWQSTTTGALREFVMTYFGKDLKHSFISKFLARNHLSMKLVGNTKETELLNRDAIITESVSWLESLSAFIERYQIQPENIKVFDKTYLATSPWHKHVRHICPQGSVKSRKMTPDRGTVEELWTTIAADGSRGPFYVSTKREALLKMNIFEDDPRGVVNLVPILQNHLGKNVAPGERGALAYFQHMIEIANYIRPGDLIIHDAEAALDTPSVQLYLASHDISSFVLPTTLHQFLSPLDNNFHSLLKLRYYRLLSDRNIGTLREPEKLQLAMDCYFDIDESVIKSLFESCALVGGLDKRQRVSQMMCEGLKVLGNHGHFHKKSLLAYLRWVRENSLQDQLCQREIDLSVLNC